MVAAFGLHEDLAIDTFGRVDVFEAISALGMRLVFRPLDNCAGFYIPPRGSRAGIAINSRHPLALQRYTAAHELGHHIFEHGEQVDRDSEVASGARGATPQERLAEAFAAWFLVPPEAAEVTFQRIAKVKPESGRDTYLAALRLGVSYSALCTHLPSLKLASPSQASSWRGRALKDVKQELTTEPPPGGWKNDVWELTGRDHESVLFVRAGDRLQFAVPESTAESIPNGATIGHPAMPNLLIEEPLIVDLAPDMDPVPADLEIVSAGTKLVYPLRIECPRLGTYIPRVRIAR